MDYSESFKIGYVTKTRGLKGELQLFFEYDDFYLIEFDLIYIEINRQLVPFFVSSYKLHSNNTGYFFLEDIDHIDKTNELVKKNVFLPLSKKPEKEDGEFLIADLKGFNVFDRNYGELGVIMEINEYPQQFVATVSHNSKDVLFPLSDDFIEEINEKEKELFVNLPDGLLDVYINEV